jgi:hypothetical protein
MFLLFIHFKILRSGKIIFFVVIIYMQLLIALVILLIILSMSISNNEGFQNLKGYHRDKQCNYQMISVLKHMIKANSLNNNTDDSWSVYLPCGYNSSQEELGKIKPTSEDQKIFIIKGCDNLSRKDNLWNSLHSEYGTVKASKIMPRTYQLGKQRDLKELKEEYSKNKVYILKKNIQRQNGLLITRNKEEILSGYKKGYVIAQEMLQDPYLIDKRKTNCRVYLLIVCKNNKKKGYIFDDGFMYYTKKSFKPNSTNRDRIITTGYIDRSVYKDNPLTLKDFDKYLTEKGNKKGLIFKKMSKLFGQTMKAVDKTICTKSNVSNQSTFQLFGCDVAFNNKLDVMLIECNKGPDLGGKDERDIEIKQGLINETFLKVGVLPAIEGRKSRFIKVY